MRLRAGRGPRFPVREVVDVGADLATAYDSTLRWHEHSWRARRSWEAEITDQSPLERIVWRSAGAAQTVGVVTFRRLGERLTRITVTIDFQPDGLFERATSGMRVSRRALRSDLMRFKAFIESPPRGEVVPRGGMP
jgi:uncharacterized membrane protein